MLREMGWPLAVVMWALACGSGGERRRRRGTWRSSSGMTTAWRFHGGAKRVADGFAGDCAAGVRAQDPQEPLRKILYFGLLGPGRSIAGAEADRRPMHADGGGSDPLVRHAGGGAAHAREPAGELLPDRVEPRGAAIHGAASAGWPSDLLRAPATPSVPGARSALVRGLFVENGRGARFVFSDDGSLHASWAGPAAGPPSGT